MNITAQSFESPIEFTNSKVFQIDPNSLVNTDGVMVDRSLHPQEKEMDCKTFLIQSGEIAQMNSQIVLPPENHMAVCLTAKNGNCFYVVLDMQQYNSLLYLLGMYNKVEEQNA